MSLFDLIAAGVKVTNLDGTEANMEGLEADGAEVDTSEDTSEEVETTEESVDTSEDASGDEEVVESSEELNTELLDVQQDVDASEEVEEQVEEAEEAAVATEAFLANLYAAKALGGLTAVHGELAVEHVKYMSGRLGFPEEHVPAIDYGFESYQTVGGVAMNTEGAIDSIKDFFIKILDGIIKGITWILDKGSELISKLFNNFEKMKQYKEQVFKYVSKIKESDMPKGDDNEHKSASGLFVLNVDGKLVSPDEAAGIILDVTNEVAAKWDVKLITGTSKKIAEETEKSVNEYANAMDFAKTGVDAINEIKGGKHVRGGAASIAALGGHLAGGGIKKWIETIIEGMPYATGKMLNQSEYSKVGFSINGQSESAFASRVLPRNKRIVTVFTNPAKIGTEAGAKALVDGKIDNLSVKRIVLRSRCVNWKAPGIAAGTKMKTMSKPNMIKTLRAIDKILQMMDTVKKKIDTAKPIISALNKTIGKLRMQYFAITKKQRDGASFMSNIRWTRINIMIVKETIGILREPGSSFCTYVLFEVKGLLDIIKKQAERYGVKGDSSSPGEKTNPFGL